MALWLSSPASQILRESPGSNIAAVPSCRPAFKRIRGALCGYDRRVRRSAGRDETASFDRAEDDEGSSWKARFVSDDEPEDQPDAKREDEDPETVAIAREKFWGRIALISLGAVLVSERLSGKGIVTALNMATGVPVWEIEPALGLLVGGLFAAAIYPVISKLLKTANSENPERVGQVLKEIVWTRQDRFQVTTGRIGCLALAGTILAEATTGKGILALLNIQTGVEITEIEAGITFLLLLLFTEDLKPSKS